MNPPVYAAAVAITVLSGVGYLAVARRSRDVWDEPGGELFAGLNVALALAAGFVAAFLVLARDRELYLMTPTGEAVALLLPVLWLGFAGRRAGFDWLTRRRVAAGGLAFAALGVEYHVANRVLEGGAAVGGTFQPVRFALVSVPWLLAVGGSIALLGGGIALVGWQALRYEHLSNGRAAALGLGVAAPWHAVWFGRFMPGYYDPTVVAWFLAAGFAVGVVGLALALERYDLFEATGAAATIGRDRVVADMDEPVVVVDDEARVLDLNDAAADRFDVARPGALGHPLEAVVGSTLERVRTAEPFTLETTAGPREFESTVSPVTDADGGVTGYSVVLRDVTERRNREQRLAVLNRVLRHNLRNEVSVIAGYAEALEYEEAPDGPRTPGAGDVVDRIIDTAHGLVELGQQTRTIEQLMAVPAFAGEGTDLAEAVRASVAAVRAEHPGAEFDLSLEPTATVPASYRILEPVFENLLENAVEHHDGPEPRVAVGLARTPDGSVAVEIADDGPGIPESELSVLESGDVSPLEHGSGLGLWVAKWGVTRVGGELSIEPREPRGTVATVRLPTSRPEPGASVAATATD